MGYFRLPFKHIAVFASKAITRCTKSNFDSLTELLTLKSSGYALTHSSYTLTHSRYALAHLLNGQV